MEVERNIRNVARINKLMEKIVYFNSVVESELAKNILKENGIISLVQKRGIEFAGDMGDSYGADLFVEVKDVDEAKKILDNYIK